MISQANVDNLIDELTILQNRIAIGLNSENPSRERVVALSVAISDHAGRVLQTIQTKAPSSSWTARLKDSDAQFFAPGLPMKTHLRRISAMSQVSSYIFAVNGNEGEVITATMQIQSVGSGTAMDYVVQTYMKSSDPSVAPTLVQKEKWLADRS